MPFNLFTKAKKPVFNYEMPPEWQEWIKSLGELELEYVSLEEAQRDAGIVYRGFNREFKIKQRQSMLITNLMTWEEIAFCETDEDEQEDDSPLVFPEPATLAEASVKPLDAAAKLEAIAAQVSKKRARTARQPTLVPLDVAQARADIKYRAEGFELRELY
jgi:hypothetical protein